MMRSSDISVEPSPKLILYLYLYLLLCLQLGSEFKYTQTAHARRPFPNDHEVKAFITVAKNLNLQFNKTNDKIEKIWDHTCEDNAELSSDFGLGCTCDKDICYFNTFVLSGKGLTGNLSEQVSELTHLERLDLSFNQFIGPIPKSLGNYLKSRTIDNCGKPRGVSSSCGCQYFYLDLQHNYLNESIPESLGNITTISTNNSKEAELEASCGYFAIYLNDNLLTGSIPRSLEHLLYLTDLNLGENHLNDSLPDELGKITSLRELSLYSNNFTGGIPSTFRKLVNLASFSVAGNYLSGHFPDVTAKWANIEYLSFEGNNFVGGNIHWENFNFTILRSLIISDLAISGSVLPQNIESNSIQYLILRNCSIGGSIPTYIGNLSSLVYLDLSFNNLSGPIPDSLRNINMSLANNHLDGAIPAWISDVAASTNVDVSFNNFSSASPEVYVYGKKSNINLFSCCPICSTCPDKMRGVVQLTNNACGRYNSNYKSTMYVNCGGEEINVSERNETRYDQDIETTLYGVNSSNNWAFSISGSFLSDDTNSSDYIRKAECRISNDETSLYETARLAPVSLKYFGYCLQNGNYTVTLHFAEIIYRHRYQGDDEDNDFNDNDNDDDNDYYISPKKRVFDIYIQSKMVRANFDGSKSLTFNTTVSTHQLEIHLYWAGKGTSSFDPPSFNGPLLSAISVAKEKANDSNKNRGLSGWQIVLITIGSIIFALLLLLAFAWTIGWLGKEELPNIKVGENKTVPLQKLLAATQNFSKEMEIGKGASGTVYKAELPDNDTVAVKKLSTLSEAGIQKLNNEIANIQNLRHENLVRMFDIYVGKGLCFLVYEYMKNKSLEDVLLDPPNKVNLDWETRFEICLGIAKGLKYLHELPRLKMVHRGIKAANILLDENFKPKISDFGLARTSTESNNAIQFQRIMEEASNGYMAPEYTAKGKELTDKYDVYAYGVVLLEIVCGKKNVSQSRKNNHEMEILVDEVRIAEKKGTMLKDMPDSSMNNIYDTKQVIIVLKLAVMCTNISSGVRPTMSQVVSVLMNERTLDEISEEDHIFRYEDFSEDEFKGIVKVSDEEDSSVTLKELIDATEIFCKSRRLGKGCFGAVYKAILPRHNHIVAVKKLLTLSDEGIDKVKKEICNFQNLRHDNLVRLFDFHLKESLCFLIYEYMENISLAEVLFDQNKKVPLNWYSRFNICLGIAKGLEYLHDQKMIHRGIKASNILLDGNFKPKISDFGLAIGYTESDNDSTQLLKIMKTEASNGYVAPEYPVKGNESISYKYDVYGFGVVLLEIVCGKKNVRHPSPSSESETIQEVGILVDEVWVAEAKGRLLSMVDKSLFSYETTQVITVLKLAVKCTSISPGVRPTMSQVVSVLTNENTLEEICEQTAGSSGEADTISQNLTEDVVRGAEIHQHKSP